MTTQVTACLEAMHRVSDQFYKGAVHCNNHAFVEFTGLINEYISICADNSGEGRDFRMSNVHTGQPLILHDYRVRYLAEKFGCIFDGAFTPQTLALFIEKAFGKEMLSELQKLPR